MKKAVPIVRKPPTIRAAAPPMIAPFAVVITMDDGEYDLLVDMSKRTNVPMEKLAVNLFRAGVRALRVEAEAKVAAKVDQLAMKWGRK